MTTETTQAATSGTVRADVRRVPLAEWLADGERRFGTDMLKWRFVCPACGHIQAVEDFRPFKAQGVTAETARFNCIGRYAGAQRRAFGGAGPGPCDYTSGGLFDIRPVTVATPDGDVRTFAFAEAPNDRLQRPGAAGGHDGN
jgi:hypothetical protein